MSAVMLVAIVGFAALAIDVGSYYQTQRQAQGAADAAALAGADAYGASGSAASASASASATATINDRGAVPTVIASSSAVTVSIATTAPSYFGRFFNRGVDPAVGARAVASVPAVSTACVTTGVNCWSIWAMDTSCSGGVQFSGGGYTVTGGIHSNGGLNTGGGGSHDGPTYYNSACTPATGGSDTFTNPGGAPQTQATSSTWPLDYSAKFPACSGAACTGPSGTPPYCNYAAASYPVSSTPTPGIYCAYGTGTPSNPATYNGAVTLSNGGYSVTATYICGTFDVSSGVNSFTAYNYPTNQLAVYANATSGTGVTWAGGGYQVDGDTFVPHAAISITAGLTGTNFLEGKDVNLSAGGYSVKGEGPSDNGGGVSTGMASLTQ